MALDIPEGFFELAFIHDAAFGTPPFVFTIGVQDVEDAGAAAVANQAFDAWHMCIQDQVCSVYTLTKVSATFSVDGGGHASVDSVQDPENGGLSDTPAPVALSLLVNKGTSTPGRRGRGRMFVPGVLKDSDVSGSGILPDNRRGVYHGMMVNFALALSGAADDVGGDPFDRAFPAITLSPCILHNDSTAVTPSPITSLTVPSKVGVLRKRLR